MSIKDLRKAVEQTVDTAKSLGDPVNAGITDNPDPNAPGVSTHNNVPYIPYKPDERLSGRMMRRAQSLSLGDPTAALENAFYGLNIKAMTAMVPQNQELTGLIFFTRPSLYLPADQCVTDRHFVELLNTDPDSYHAAIRAYLDPKGHVGNNVNNTEEEPYINSNLVDPCNPFISLLTNSCKTLNGWPDPIMDNFISEPGRRQEVYGLADGIYKVNGQFDLTGTFKNLPFDPVRYIFDRWGMYQSNIKLRRMIPRLESIHNIRVNYQTRIWRIVLDKSRTKVTRIACTGASWPVVTDIGRIFDYDAEKTQVEANDVSMQFKCVGAIYNDPILYRLFNTLVSWYQPKMKDDRRASDMVALSPSEWNMYNHYAYPHIDEHTRDFVWYCTRDDYAALTDYYGGVDKEPSSDTNKEKADGVVDKITEKLRSEIGNLDDATNSAKERFFGVPKGV